MRIIRMIKDRNKRIREHGAAKGPPIHNPPEVHHLISEDKGHKLVFANWLAKHHRDVALSVSSVPRNSLGPDNFSQQDFTTKMKDHLLSRLRDEPLDPTDSHYTRDDRSTLEIVGACIYQHQTFKVNYTTYDIRRAQDCLNPQTKADIMVLAPT